MLWNSLGELLLRICFCPFYIGYFLCSVKEHQQNQSENRFVMYNKVYLHSSTGSFVNVRVSQKFLMKVFDGVRIETGLKVVASYQNFRDNPPFVYWTYLCLFEMSWEFAFVKQFVEHEGQLFSHVIVHGETQFGPIGLCIFRFYKCRCTADQVTKRKNIVSEQFVENAHDARHSPLQSPKLEHKLRADFSIRCKIVNTLLQLKNDQKKRRIGS